MVDGRLAIRKKCFSDMKPLRAFALFIRAQTPQFPEIEQNWIVNDTTRLSSDSNDAMAIENENRCL